MLRLDSTVGGSRDEALDFVKGSLVLVMVLYHWLNYFVSVNWDVYRYLRFLTPSFILITGFLVSHVYLKTSSYDSPRLRRRLVQRGLKLLLLFAALNLLAGMAFGAQTNAAGVAPTSWPSRVHAIFVTGDRGAAFNILVPISYFLVLAPFVLLVSKRTRISLTAIAVTGVAVMIGASSEGFSNFNLEMLSVALVGLAAGAVEFSRILAIVRQPALLLVGYALYLAAITIWNVLFPLQVVGVCLSVVLIYFVGMKWGTRGTLQQCAVELGKYSLFSYIVQIAALQLMRRGLRGVDWSGAELLIPFATGLAATIAAVRLMVVVRGKSILVDRMYRTVFA